MFQSRAFFALLLTVGGCSNRTTANPRDGVESSDESTTPAPSGETVSSPSGDGAAPSLPDAGDTSADPLLTVRLGVPDAESALNFAPLPDDGSVKIRMGGQGGTHAILGLQCSGFGNRILYEIRIEDARGGGAVTTPTLPAPRPIFCDDEGLCKLVPINVVIGGLAPPEEWPNLPVLMTLTVSNADGLSASTTAEGYLDPT